MIAEEAPLLPLQLFQGVSPQRITIMSRASRMQAFTAQLNDDAYLDALLDEAYKEVYGSLGSIRQVINTGSRLLQGDLAHIGSGAKHGSWQADTHDEYADVDSLLQTSDDTGKVRMQIMLYAQICLMSIRVDDKGIPAQVEKWSDIVKWDRLANTHTQRPHPRWW